MKIMVSACLLGENCKYNGKNNSNKENRPFFPHFFTKRGI